ELLRKSLTFDTLDGLRRRTDPLADELLDVIWAEPALQRDPDLLGVGRRLEARGEPAAVRFFSRTRQLPPWVSFERFVACRELFFRCGVVGLLVGLTVLVESYAGARDNKVLMMSGRLTDKGAFRRLVETATFMIDCVDDESLRPGGQGHTAALSVRLLHAKV